MKWCSIGLLLLSWSCATETYCRRPSGPPSPDDCVQEVGPAGAAVLGAANAGVWASGNGCQLSGCHPTLVCNKNSGFCERPVCGEGRGPCPLGTTCNSTTLRCQ